MVRLFTIMCAHADLELLRALAPASEFAAIDQSWQQGGIGYGA